MAFPIAFLVGALVFDGAGRVGDWPTVWTTGAYLSLGAVLTGLVAAVPGLIDYFLAVPPDSSGKKRATKKKLFAKRSRATMKALRRELRKSASRKALSK